MIFIDRNGTHWSNIQNWATAQTNILRLEHNHSSGNAVAAERAGLLATGVVWREDGAGGDGAAVFYCLPEHHQRSDAEDLGKHINFR